MNTETSEHSIPTQKQRWIKYGLNVGLLIVAATVIVCIANYVAYQRFVRLDFTHNRRYTLSPQTMKLLQSLPSPVSLTTLYSDNSDQAEKLKNVDNLLAEYQRRGKQVSISRMDPTVDLPRFESFLEKLLSRFSDEIQSRRDVIAKSLETLEQVEAFTKDQSQALPLLLTRIDPKDARTATLVRQLDQIFQRIAVELPEVKEGLQKLAKEPLLDFDNVRMTLERRFNLSGLDSGVLKPAVESFTSLIDQPGTPNAAKDQLLGLRDQYRKLQEEARKAVQRLEQVQFGPYDEIRSKLQNQNCVAIVADLPAAAPKEADKADTRGVAILTIDDLYPGFLTSQEVGDRQRPEQTYKGEEAITAAILKLSVKHKTRVVLVNPSAQPALMGQPGQNTYQTVAQRLEAMNIKVQEWQPAGGMMFGRPSPPQPKPVAAEGESLIYVVLPPGQPTQQMPFSPGEAPAAAAVKEHLAAGRPVMLILSPTSMLGLGTPDNPILDALKDWGIAVDSKRVVVRPMPGSPQGATNRVDFNVTLPQHPIAQAIGGLPGVMLAAQPINSQITAGIKVWPLVETPENSWASADAFPMSPDRMAELAPGPQDPKGPLTVALAAEKEKGRLVVVADPVWATDYIATAGMPVLTGRRDISIFSYFPANTELFINGVYWLAGLDDLIAPGARSQDIRRLTSISPGAMSGVRWLLLAVMPAGCLAAGIGVWFIRRR